MKRHAKLVLKILLFLPIVLGVVLVNWVVDPANVFMEKESANELVSQVASGKKVTLSHDDMNWDGRFVIKKFVGTLKERVEVIVLGSSRSMMVSPDLFPGRSFFNASVSSAGIEDYILNYGFFREKGMIPSVVVIGVDESIFDSFRSSRFKQWVAYRETYEYMMRQMLYEKSLWTISVTDRLPPQYLELFSFGYFQSSLFALQHQTRPPLWSGLKQKIMPPASQKGKFIVTENEYNEFLTILPGFVITPTAAHRQLPADQVEEQLTREMKSIANVSQRYHFDRERVELFEKFINLLKRDHVEIILFLPPKHPAAIGYAQMPQYRNQLEKIEGYFRSLARQKDIKIVGSYFNETAGLPVSRFYDEHHLRTMDDVRGMFFASGLVKK